MKAIEELIYISHAIGKKPDLIQAGGGNTSVKEGGKMFIKASGTALKDMTTDNGIAVIELLSGKSKLKNTRPSMETPMHTFLPRVIIHSHPIYLNIFLCQKNAHKNLDFLADLSPLYVMYATPGLPLAKKLERAWQKQPSAVILLENHGLITAAETSDEALRLHIEVTKRAKRRLSGQLKDLPAYSFKYPVKINSRFIFPDAVVFGDNLESINSSQREILSAHSYIIDTINALGESPSFLPKTEIQRLRTLDSEIYRRSLPTTT